MKVRLLYRDRGDHISFRDASEPIVDPRDLRNGKPPAWFLPHVPIEKEATEVEFDHIPSEAELDAAFPDRTK